MFSKNMKYFMIITISYFFYDYSFNKVSISQRHHLDNLNHEFGLV